MSLPFARITLVVTLLLEPLAARAQPGPSRERRERTVTVTGNPADPPLEVRVAKGTATVLFFKSRINRDAIELDGRGTRITLEPADSALILEPLLDLNPTERLILRVPFADGQAPAQAAFALVQDPAEVDTRLDVARGAHGAEACQAELVEVQATCARLSPIRFARAGGLTPLGLNARDIKECRKLTPTDRGPTCIEGTAYRAESWALVILKVRNGTGLPPWRPREAMFRATGSEVWARGLMEVAPVQIAAGTKGLIFVEISPSQAGESLELALKDEAGVGMTIHKVDLSLKARE